MLILRKYQLDVIFLFLACAMLLWTAFLLLSYLGADPHDYEWYVGLPVIGLYLVYLWKVRAGISIADRRAMTGKSLCYWVILGIILFSSYTSPIPAARFISLDVLFLLLTILLADSYWDFKKLSWRSLVDKRELK
ncbi:MAG: hypothetical protein Q7S66_02235 [bacterium]|nr:hypothetical protein [bacterium]